MCKKFYKSPVTEIVFVGEKNSLMAASVKAHEEDGQVGDQGGEAKGFFGIEDEENSLTDYNAWNTWGDNENHDRL